MILTDTDIRATCAASGGGITIEPFDDAALQPASYDLRVGPEAASSKRQKVVDLAAEAFVNIEPGDFVIVSTHEVLELDAWHVGRFGLMSKHARRGLIATVGPQIDPGFHGRLFVGLTNLSTKAISLAHRELFLSTEFHRLDKPAESVYGGPHQGLTEMSPDQIRDVMEREYLSQSDMMRTLQALVSTVDGLEHTVDGLQSTVGALNHRLPLWLGLFLTLFSGIVAAIVAYVG